MKTIFEQPDFIQEVLAIGKGELSADYQVLSIRRPLERARLRSHLPIPDDVPMDAVGNLERYELLDYIEPEVLQKKLCAISQVLQFNHHLSFVSIYVCLSKLVTILNHYGGFIIISPVAK